MKLPDLAWLDWSAFDGSTIMVKTAVQTSVNALNEPVLTQSTVYHGPANQYDNTGAILQNQIGSLAEEKLKVLISLKTLVGIPIIAVGDTVTIDNDPAARRFSVTWSHVNDIAPFSIELDCDLAKG